MPALQQESGRRETLNLRIKPELRGLIDRAAKLTGKNRTDFVLTAARHAAEDVLMDRTVFAVSAKAYAKFLARLDAPPQPNDRLRRTLQTPAPWEK
jgi:uncharacterized protein (DUF1778 family)